MTYKKIDLNDPVYRHLKGLVPDTFICDSDDHNDETGCSNPKCWKTNMKVQTTETGRFKTPPNVHTLDAGVLKVIRWMQKGYRFHMERMVFDGPESTAIIPTSASLADVGQCLFMGLIKPDDRNEYMILTVLGKKVKTA